MEISMDQIRNLMDDQSTEDLTQVALKDSKTLEEYGIDSMGLVSLAFDLDDLANIQLDDSALEKMRTFGDVKNLLISEGVTIV